MKNFKPIALIGIFFLCICVNGLVIYGQLIVNDPTANATAVQNVALTKLSLAESKKEVLLLKETIKKLQKVSAKINELNMLENALNTQRYTIQRSTKYAKELQLSGQFTGEDVAKIVGNFNQIIQASTRTIRVIRLILKNNGLEMNDSERLRSLEEATKEVNDHRVAVDQLYRTYQRVAIRRYTYSFLGVR